MFGKLTRPSGLRAIITVALAYALVLSGLVGAMASAAHSNAFRLSDPHVLCLTHDPAEPETGSLPSDPLGSGMACIEHCTFAATTQTALLQPGPALPVRLLRRLVAEGPPPFAPGKVRAVPAPPAPRGPPNLL
jgi:hypothetical protein